MVKNFDFRPISLLFEEICSSKKETCYIVSLNLR